MVVNTARKSKSKPKAGRRFGVAVLASCIGAGTILAAAPSAFALDGWDMKSVPQNPSVSISKTDAETGAPLSGAVFEVTVRNPHSLFIGIGGAYDLVDPATYSFTTASEHAKLTWEEYRDREIERHNATIAADLPRYNALIAQRDAIDPVAAQAAIDAYNEAVAEAAPYQAAYDAARAAADAHAAEMTELEALGASRTPEQTARLAVLMGEWAGVQAARDDALAAYQPFGQAVSDLSAANAQGINDLAALPGILAELAAFPDMTVWTADENGVDQADFEARSAAWHAVNDTRVAASTAQAACNETWGVPTTPIRVEGLTQTYLIATCEGVGSLPVGSIPEGNIVEVTAPDGYVLDGTVFTAQRYSEATFRFRDANVSVFGGVMSFTNVAEPPVEPPVEPEEPETPVKPEEPKTPEKPETPKTPETLAYTGSDANGALAAGGIAAALLAAGGALFAFRRRTASE